VSAPTLKIRCPSWEHLENFYDQKVKEGNVLLARVPFSPVVGSEITISLELPDGRNINFQGRVDAVRQAPDGRKSALRMILHGLDGTMRARLEKAVSDGRELLTPPPEPVRRTKGTRTEDGLPLPIPADVPIDELIPEVVLPAVEEVPEEAREQYRLLDSTLRSLREKAAHEVLGVEWDADVATIRLAYFKLIKNYHPDVVARHDSDEVSLIASELFIYINKAYDRLRDSAVAAGKAIAAGPALLPHDGWIADFDDLGPLTDPSILRPHRWAEPQAPATAEPETPEAPVSEEPASEAPGAPPAQPMRETGLFEDARRTNSGSKPLLEAAVAIVDGPAGDGKEEEEIDVDALLEEGRALLDDKEYDQGRVLFAALLESKPRNRHARALYHVAYGHTLIAREKAEEALTQFEVALKHDPACRHAKAARATGSGKRRRRPSLLERILRR
jgi:tetratricopeptide (TPR) repeat protein